MAATRDLRRTGRPLAAAARGAREGDRPRRIHPPDAACPACCMAKSSAAPWRTAASSRSTSAPRARFPASSPSTPATTCATVIPDPYYGPAFHDQPILAIGKVHYVGEPVAVVLAAIRISPSRPRSRSSPNTRNCRRCSTRSRRPRTRRWCTTSSSPPAPSPTSSISRAAKGTNIALDFRLRRGDVDKAFASAAHVFEHTFRTQKVLHLALEPFASIADYRDDGVTIYSASQGPSFVRTEIARLLGWPENRVRIKVPYLGGGYGGKLYIKLEALAVALSMLARRPVKVALTMEEQFYTITKHPSTFRIKSGVDKNGRIVARKCEIWWNGGAYADIGPRVTQKSGFTASGPLRHRQRLDRFLRALYQSDAGRRAARLRHSATGVGLRKPHRHDRARAQARSARIPQAESAARRPPAGDRHHPEGRRDREGARPHRRAAQLEGAVRPRQRRGAARPRPRGRAQGGDLADHVGGRSSTSRPTAAPRSIAAPSTWGRAPTRRWRRSSARCSTCRRRPSASCRATPT